MNQFLMQAIAFAIAAGQVFTRPSIQTKFDPIRDQTEVAHILRDGCKHIMGQPETQGLDIDALFELYIEAADLDKGSKKTIGGVSLEGLRSMSKSVCEDGSFGEVKVDLAQVIESYNETLKDLPDVSELKGKRLPQMSVVKDVNGQPFTEVYREKNRRIWMPIEKIPEVVKLAFVAAEDKKFFKRKFAADEWGLVSAAIDNLQSLLKAEGDNDTEKTPRLRGGSTITQQLIKNEYLDGKVSFERKTKEIVLAARLEQVLSKEEILERYLNSIFLGRASWGVEMAAKSYLKKSITEVSYLEAVFLAGQAKGPGVYSPDVDVKAALGRTKYVANQLKIYAENEKTHLKSKEIDDTLKVASLPEFPSFESPRAKGGFYFTHDLVQTINSQLQLDPTDQSLEVEATINPQLQKYSECALQEGLAEYEIDTKRVAFMAPEKNLSEKISDLKKNSKAQPSIPFWQQALIQAYLPLYDVCWPPAVVLSVSGGNVKVGLKNGDIVPLTAWSNDVLRKLSVYDVVHVSLAKQNSVAELRARPQVQGSALIMESKTGKILAMVGGFSFPLSHFNRVYAKRQPGSSVKPLTYLAAAQAGYQTNTKIMDQPIILPPISRGGDWWSPANIGQTRENPAKPTTVRFGLQYSKNRVAAELLKFISADRSDHYLMNLLSQQFDAKFFESLNPQTYRKISQVLTNSLDQVLNLMKACGLDEKPERVYPTILGASGEGVRMIDLVTCYASLANFGERPKPHLFESIKKDGQTIYQFNEPNNTDLLKHVDAVSIQQIRSLLQGVIRGGTASKMNDDLKDLMGANELSDYFAGKTGTSQQANDVWFAGFTGDVTLAVWVGYDNGKGSSVVTANGKRLSGRQTLGAKATGGNTAVPIVKNLIRAIAATINLKPIPELTSQDVLAYASDKSGNIFQFPSDGHLPIGYFKDFIRIKNGQRVDTSDAILGGGQPLMADEGLDGDRFMGQQLALSPYQPRGFSGPYGPYGRTDVQRNYPPRDRYDYGPRYQYQGPQYGQRYNDGYYDAPMTDPTIQSRPYVDPTFRGRGYY